MTSKGSPIASQRPTPLLTIFAWIVSWGLAGLAGTAPTLGQAPAQEPGVSVTELDRAFEESVDVQLVNVEVRVTDRRGKPLTGLKAEDFEVFEDRKPVKVLHFAEVRPGQRPAPESDAVSSGAPSTDRPAEAVASPAHLVLYFDNSHLRPAGRKRLIEDLKELISTNQLEADRILMLTQNPWIQTLAPFGSSPAELITALDALDRSPAKGPEIDRERAQLMDRLAEIFELASTLAGTPCELIASEGLNEIHTYSLRVQARVGTTLQHLATLAGSLAGLPGAKSVLYFGGGLELIPTLDPIHYVTEVCPGMEETSQRFGRKIDLTPRFQRLTRHANGNQVTFYTLESSGLPAQPWSSVDHAGFDWRPSPLNEQIRRGNLQNSLSFLASDTGGRAVFDTNRLADSILEAHRESTAYYSLAYAPLHDGDGRVHMIDVNVDKKGARIRHRYSYRDKHADERMADRLQAALTLGIETNPLGIRLERNPVVPGDGPKKRIVPVVVEVPLTDLVFLAEDDGHVGRLRLQVAARDHRGRMSAFHQKYFEVELDPSLGGMAEGTHRFVIDLTMEVGDYIVAVGLRDEIGRTASFQASKISLE